MVTCKAEPQNVTITSQRQLHSVTRKETGFEVATVDTKSLALQTAPTSFVYDNLYHAPYPGTCAGGFTPTPTSPPTATSGATTAGAGGATTSDDAI